VGEGSDARDTDGDGTIDALDTDSDGDGAADKDEGTADTDNDGTPDCRDTDSDADGVLDATDNCRIVVNEDQADYDGNGVGDRCTDDYDGDTVKDETDNCKATKNPDQADLDADGIGDACDDDVDGDGIPNSVDGEGDADNDGIPNFRDTDADGDGVADATEGALGDAPAGTVDTDKDGTPDFLDTDSDADGLDDAREGTKDSNGNGIPDFRDADSDGNGLNDGFNVDGGANGCSSTGGSGSLFGLLGLAVAALRRGRRSAVAASAAAVLAPAAAYAVEVREGGFSAERFVPTLDGSGILDAEGGNLIHRRYQVGLWTGYAHNPLVITRNSNGAEGVLVQNRVGATLMGALRLTNRLEVAVQLPFVLTQGRDVSNPDLGSVELLGFSQQLSSATLVGDPRLAGKLLLWSNAERGLAVSAVLGVALPLGAWRAFGGEAGVAFEPMLAASWLRGHWEVAANLGGFLRTRTPDTTLSLGQEFRWKLGGRYWVDDARTLGVALGLSGAVVSWPTSSDAGNQRRALQTPVEALLGVTKGLGPVTVDVGAGAGLVNGFGATDLRLFASVRFPTTMVDGDEDKDGVEHWKDRCPDAVGSAGDGCPAAEPVRVPASCPAGSPGPTPRS
jgi:MYXO-CTERM domain-containing protein